MTKKALTSTSAALCFFMLFSGMSAYAQGDEARQKKELIRQEQQAQNRNLNVYKYLEKGRKEREIHNYKAARACGEKALKLDADNRAAQAFLDQLVIEEELYNQYHEELKERKIREKEAKAEEKLRSKEEKQRQKTESQEEKLRLAEEKKAQALAAKEAKKAKESVRVSEGQSVREEAAKEPEERQEDKEKPEEKPEPRAQSPEPGDGEKVEGKVEEAKPSAERPAPSKEKAAPSAPFDGGLPGSFAGLAKPGQPIIVDGDKVEYFEEDGRVVAEGNVSITYGDVKLTCDRIEVNTSAKLALCEGNVRIEQADGVLTGDRIRYDLANKRGEIIEGEVSAFPWFGQAEETSKVGDNEYLLKNGFITTCDLSSPHYRLKAGEIRVFPDDKVIAKNVVTYIGKVPVMWFPYYYHPIIQTKAKVQLIPGSSSDWGYFLLSAWRFYLKGNTKIDILSDYRSKKGFAGGANLYYNGEDFGLDALGYGVFKAYFINQNGFGTYDPTEYRDEGTDEKWRNRYQWKHRIDFDPTTIGMIEFNKYSDEYMMKDYFYNEYEQSEPIPPNYMSIISSKSNYTFSVEANKRFNDFYTVVQRLPEVKIDIPNQRLWETSFYYTSETSATAFEKEYERDLDSPREKVQRLDTYHKLSYATGVGPLNIVPFGEIRETAYTRRNLDKKSVLRTSLSGGVDTFMRFHRIYDVETDYLGLDINGLRHIIVPKATYFHRPQPKVHKDDLYQMDELDAMEKENYVSLSLENKLQTKHGPASDLKATDLVRTIVSVDYFFRMKKKSFDFVDGGQFRNLNFDLEVRPYDWLYVDGRLEINPQNQSVSTGSVEFSMIPSESFRLDLGYRYEKMSPDPRNQLTFDMWYVINPKWRLGLYERFDIQGREIEEQQLSITRDLHCWETELVYDLKGSNFFEDEFSIWLAFRIKAFPDLYLGLSRSFTKQAPGARPVQAPR